MSGASSDDGDDDNESMEDTSSRDDGGKDESENDSGSASVGGAGGSSDSSSSIGEAENDDDDDEEDMMNQDATTGALPQGLSKSWAVRSAHVPIYTGGTMALMKIVGDANDDNDDEAILLCTLVHGDVCLSTLTGVKYCSLRGKGDDAIGEGGGDDEAEEEDDEGYDVDTVTCFVVLPTSPARILTCSFNSVIRQYTILLRNGDGNGGSSRSKTKSYAARLIGVLGKSGHTLPVNTMVAHGAFLATGSVDGSVRVFDTRQTAQFAPTHVFRGSNAKVTTVAWYPGTLQELVLGIGRDDGSIAIHNLLGISSARPHKGKKSAAGAAAAQRNDVPMALLKDHDSAVTCLVWDVERQLFYTAGRDSVIIVWKMIVSPNGTERSRRPEQLPTTIIQYQKVQTVPVYERVEGMQLIYRTTPPHDVKQTAYLVSAGSKGILRLWQSGEDDDRLLERAKQSEKDVFGEARGGYLAMIRHDYDRAVVLVADAEHNVLLVKIAERPDGSSVDARPMLRLQTVETIVGHNDEILDVRVVPNSNDVAVVTNSHLVRLFDRDTFRCRVLDQHHTATVLCVDASPCGRYLATCGKDQTMRIWHTATGRCVGNAVGHTEAVGSTALSRQSGRYQVSGKAAQNGGGSFVVTVSVDRTMKRWNLPGDAALDEAAATETVLAFKAVASARAHDKDINIVSIAPNDSLIATGSQDKTIALWKAVDLSQVAVLKGHRRGVWDCQFSPYDRVLASSSGDKTIKLWSLSDYSCVRTFHGHSASVLRVRYLLGGLQLVSAGADGLVKLWTVRTNECEATMDSHTGKIWGMDVVCGGEDNGPQQQQQQQRLLFTGAADSRLVAWKDTTAAVHAEKLKEREEEILLNQQLMNHIRRKEYKAALRVSLERDKPHTSLKILNEIFNAESAAASREPPLASIKSFIKEQPLPLVVRLLRYCREWNVRARHSHVALTVVQVIVSTISVATLAAQEDVPEIIAGMIPYIERHFERLDRLHTSAYLVDFCATSMGIMDAEDNAEPSATTAGAADKDDSAAGSFAKWEASAEFKPLVKTVADGRVDLGGNVAVRVSLQSGAEDSDEVITVGESDSEDESSSSS